MALPNPENLQFKILKLLTWTCLTLSMWTVSLKSMGPLSCTCLMLQDQGFRAWGGSWAKDRRASSQWENRLQHHIPVLCTIRFCLGQNENWMGQDAWEYTEGSNSVSELSTRPNKSFPFLTFYTYLPLSFLHRWWSWYSLYPCVCSRQEYGQNMSSSRLKWS